MAKVSIVRPGEGEILASGPAQVRILETGEHTEHRLGFAEVTVPPGFPSPLQHRHAQHDEGFYVLSGTIRFTIGEDDHDAGPGTWVIVPTGAPHTFANPGDETAVMLNTFTPDLYVQYFRDFKALIDSGQPVDADSMKPLWKNYATEISTEYASPSPAAGQTFMVVGTLRADTDFARFGALREAEHRQLDVLRSEKRVGAHYVSMERGATFVEIIAADEREATETLRTLPFAQFFDVDVYPIMPPDAAELAHRAQS